MAKPPKNAISPTRAEDFPEWFQQVITGADLAENSDVRGCMVIKPWGYGIWENMQRSLDAMFKETGHENAYFPLFIPLSFLEKEAKHVEGFAKECAVVTHHRLEATEDGGLVPAAPLTEPLIVRPTSETIIGAAYARWVQSYRDLPILINQWANVVRWEMRPRVFLRTTEFLWQEGHTAHETKEEAIEETKQMLEVYETFAKEHLAIPVIPGHKSESERFPGADDTLCIEAMVQDKKAVQAGTSHFLGQNFAKAQEIKFSGRDGELHHAWTTSWGVSTRLVGTVVMAHSDDDGLVLPPRVAPSHVILLPVLGKGDDAAVLEACDQLRRRLRDQRFHGEPIRVTIDDSDENASSRSWKWIKKGAPIRAEIGPRDLEGGTVFMGRRDLGPKEKKSVPMDAFVETAPAILQEIQDAIYQRALDFREENTKTIDSKEDFYAFFTPEKGKEKAIHGGFAYAHWNGSAEVEEQIKNDLKVTIRCLPTDRESEPGVCPFSGDASARRVIFSKSY